MVPSEQCFERSRPRFWCPMIRMVVVAAAWLSLSFGSPTVLAANGAAPEAAAAACMALANLSGFPVPATTISAVHFNAAGAVVVRGVALPAHCQIDGVINRRVGSDGQPYGDGFEVRLPVPAAWNGRFMFQGGGGAEGRVPPAVGRAGSLSPTLAHGWAVASQDGGHEASQLSKPFDFYLEHQGLVDQTYRSIDVTTQTAKYLIKTYYGEAARHSYWVGCSTGGRQGMVMSQHFPTYFDGIIAGDPVYDLEALNMSEDWAVEHTLAIAPRPVTKTSAGLPLLYYGFPKSDQQLFTKALLQACDGLDGKVDGVIDDQPACGRKFHPATFVFTDTHQPLQCASGKMPTCLSRQQILAVEAINRGPRDGSGRPVKAPAGAVAPDHADNTMWGYAYDGGFMSRAGIPGRTLGTPTRAPADLATGVAFVPYLWVQPVNLRTDPLRFNFSTDLDKLTRRNILVTYSTSLDISAFVHRGGKIIWYHGASDPGPPVEGTIAYYRGLAAQNGGYSGVEQFARLYLVPNMGHCGGGPSTDEFDLLTPLVAWVERGEAPGPVIASGKHFVSPPQQRQRPLCPYPQQVRYVRGDLAKASSYECVVPSGTTGR